MSWEQRRIGFISTRLAGTDGVSLEAAKWSDVLTDLGHECFYFAGESEWPAERSHLVPEAHFKHPEIQAISADLFDDYVRLPETSRRIGELKELLKIHLHRFVRDFDLELLIAENILALPMNVPLGLALTELIAETDLPVIAHHHDFTWERERYAVTAGEDYLRAAFPPTLPSIHHVVINTFAGRQLALRTGVSSTLVPNVMDFDSPLVPPGEYCADLRDELGIRPGERLLLQPTRIVPRKQIERAIELARRLDLSCALVISHEAGDEGGAYAAYLEDYARLMGVRVIFAADRIDYYRGQTADGRKVYSLADAYHQADLVTYPSRVEGFGNAFLETIYHRRPIVMSTYEIFKTDIQPKGFKIIGFEDFICDDTVRQARAALTNPALVSEMVEHNYEVGRHHYSFAVLKTSLSALLNECVGTA